MREKERTKEGIEENNTEGWRKKKEITLRMF